MKRRLVLLLLGVGGVSAAFLWFLGRSHDIGEDEGYAAGYREGFDDGLDFEAQRAGA